jgi:hypothetical protein
MPQRAKDKKYLVHGQIFADSFPVSPGMVCLTFPSLIACKNTTNSLFHVVGHGGKILLASMIREDHENNTVVKGLVHFEL